MDKNLAIIVDRLLSSIEDLKNYKLDALVKSNVEEPYILAMKLLYCDAMLDLQKLATQERIVTLL